MLDSTPSLAGESYIHPILFTLYFSVFHFQVGESLFLEFDFKGIIIVGMIFVLGAATYDFFGESGTVDFSKDEDVLEDSVGGNIDCGENL